MEKKEAGIRIIPGTRDFLVIAPHGPFIEGVFQNDIRTGVIAEKIQSGLNCTVIINDRYFKPKGPIKKSVENFFLDLFRIDHAGKVPEFLNAIKSVVEESGKTMVLFIHGIADDVAFQKGEEHAEKGFFDKKGEDLHALIGFGQGGDPKKGDKNDRFSANLKTVTQLKDHLTASGMTTLLTHNQSRLFRGRDAKRLNQWFVQSGYGFDRVESLQLEIREKGFRDSNGNANRTALIITETMRYLKNT